MWVAGDVGRLPATHEWMRRTQIDASVGQQKGEIKDETNSCSIRGKCMRKWGTIVSGKYTFSIAYSQTVGFRQISIQ